MTVQVKTRQTQFDLKDKAAFGHLLRVLLANQVRKFHMEIDMRYPRAQSIDNRYSFVLLDAHIQDFSHFPPVAAELPEGSREGLLLNCCLIG